MCNTVLVPPSSTSATILNISVFVSVFPPQPTKVKGKAPPQALTNFSLKTHQLCLTSSSCACTNMLRAPCNHLEWIIICKSVGVSQLRKQWWDIEWGEKMNCGRIAEELKQCTVARLSSCALPKQSYERVSSHREHKDQWLVQVCVGS